MPKYVEQTRFKAVIYDAIRIKPDVFLVTLEALNNAQVMESTPEAYYKVKALLQRKYRPVLMYVVDEEKILDVYKRWTNMKGLWIKTLEPTETSASPPR